MEQAVGMDAGAKDDAECAICRQYVHLAAVECDCCPGRRTCLRHAAALCECAPEGWRLAFRHSLGELEALAEEVAARVPAGAPVVLIPHMLHVGFQLPGSSAAVGRAGGSGRGGNCKRARRRAGKLEDVLS